eukprot:Opistho-2@63195
MIFSPLEQFQLQRLVSVNSYFPVDLVPTNSMIVAFLSLFIILILHSSLTSTLLVPHRFQLVLQDLYLMLNDTFYDSLGSYGRRFYDTGATLFITLASANLAGLVPYSFASTAQAVVALGLSFSS